MTSGLVVMFRQSLQFLALLVVWFTYYTLLPRFLCLTMILLIDGRSRLSPQASFTHLPVCFFGFIFVTIIPFPPPPWSRKARVMSEGEGEKKKKTRLLLPASSPRRNNTNNPKETAASPRFVSAARPGDLSPGVRCSTGHCGSLTLN